MTIKPHNDNHNNGWKWLPNSPSFIIIIRHTTAAGFIIVIITCSACGLLVTLTWCCHCTAVALLQTLASICHHRLQNDWVLVNLQKLRIQNNVNWQAFSVVGPSVWNSLPDYLHNSGVGRDKFRQHLKTFMFASYYSIRGFTFMCYINLCWHWHWQHLAEFSSICKTGSS